MIGGKEEETRQGNNMRETKTKVSGQRVMDRK